MKTQWFILSVMFFLVFCHNLQAQSAVQFIGKDIGEVQFIADRKGIKLSEPTELNGTTYIMYTPSKKLDRNPKQVDLGIHYTLMFDGKRNNTCRQVECIPTIQEKWVPDTLINRLVKMRFKQVDVNTLVHRNPDVIALLKYDQGFLESGRPVKVNLLKLVFIDGEALKEDK